MLQNVQNVAKFQKFRLDNLVDLEKCCKTRIFLQKSVPIQQKTSEICHTLATTLRLTAPAVVRVLPVVGLEEVEQVPTLRTFGARADSGREGHFSSSQPTLSFYPSNDPPFFLTSFLQNLRGAPIALGSFFLLKKKTLNFS